jgi:hypothetical protein
MTIGASEECAYGELCRHLFVKRRSAAPSTKEACSFDKEEHLEWKSK